MPQRTRVLVLSEDRDFAEKLMATAALNGVDLCWKSSLVDLGSVGCLGQYDVLLVEYQLGPVDGLEIAEYADTFFPGLPVLMISAGPVRARRCHWPRSIVGFVRKKDSPKEIIRRLLYRSVPASNQVRKSARLSSRVTA